MTLKIATLVILSATSIASATRTIDFADQPLAPGAFDNRGPTPNSNGFVSNGARFNNNYSNDFGPYWNGWSLSAVADPTTAGFGNQYAAFAGSGFGGAGTYAVAYEDGFNAVRPTIDLPIGERPVSVRVTNTTYAAKSMLLGGDFPAKKFGGATGNEPDFFSVTFTGHALPGGLGATTSAVTFVLADYRFANTAQDYVVGDWRFVDLTPLGEARSITLSFASTDVGAFGINTPTYAAIDNLVLVPEPATLGLFLLAVARRRR